MEVETTSIRPLRVISSVVSLSLGQYASLSFNTPLSKLMRSSTTSIATASFSPKPSRSKRPYRANSTNPDSCSPKTFARWDETPSLEVFIAELLESKPLMDQPCSLPKYRRTT